MGLSFNGTDNHAELPLPVVFNNIAANDFTVSLWLNFGDITNGITFIRGVDIYFDDNNYVQIYISSSAPGQLNAVIVDAGTERGDGADVPISIDTWYYITLAWDATGNTLMFYINAAVQTGAVPSGLGPGAVQAMTLARRSDAASATYAEVIIEDFRVYDRELTIEEIETIYNNRGHDGIVDGLVSRYPLNESVGDAEVDTHLVDSVVTTVASAGSIAVTVPSHSSGDLLVAMICPGGNAGGTPANVTTPAGWTFIGTVDCPGTASTPSLWVYRRTAGGSEPGSYTFSINQTSTIVAVMASYDGNVINTSEENAVSNSGTSASPSASSVSPTTNSVILRICVMDDSVLPSPEFTFFPANTVFRDAEEDTGVGNGCGLGFSDHLVPSGATGAAIFTLSGSDQWATFTISFNGGGAFGTDILKDHSETQADGTPINSPAYAESILSYRKRV